MASNKSIIQWKILFSMIVLFYYFVLFNQLWDSFSWEKILF